MADINPEEEMAALLAGVQRELTWIMILTLFPLLKMVNLRREATTTEDVTYLLLRQITEAVDYAGETSNSPGRFFNHKMFELFGEDFVIVLFGCRGHLPKVVRKSLEAILKIIFQPPYCEDMDQAHMNEKRISIVRLLLQYSIMQNCPDPIFRILNSRIPLFPVDVSKSKELEKIKKLLLLNYKTWRAYNGKGKMPVDFGTLGE